MFTGIITDIGQVRVAETANQGQRFTISTAYDMTQADIGASIACSGTCLTIVDKGADWFAAQASKETLGCTTLGTWSTGTAVNLERPMRAGDEFGGHIVQGHVDGLGHIAEIEPIGESHRVRFAPPVDLMPMIAPKGSIAVDGVSLTVNGVGEDWFEVNLIPHTWAHTTFRSSAPGGHVNLEVDVLARYAAQILHWSRR